MQQLAYLVVMLFRLAPQLPKSAEDIATKYNGSKALLHYRLSQTQSCRTICRTLDSNVNSFINFCTLTTLCHWNTEVFYRNKKE